MDIRGGDILKVILLRLFKWLPWKTSVQNLGLLCKSSAKIRREFYLKDRVRWGVTIRNAEAMVEHWISCSIQPQVVEFMGASCSLGTRFDHGFEVVVAAKDTLNSTASITKLWPNASCVSFRIKSREKDITIPSHVTSFEYKRSSKDADLFKCLLIHDKVKEIIVKSKMPETCIFLGKTSALTHVTLSAVQLERWNPVFPDTVAYLDMTINALPGMTHDLKMPNSLDKLILRTKGEDDVFTVRLSSHCHDLTELYVYSSSEASVKLPTFKKLKTAVLNCASVDFIDGVQSLSYISNRLQFRRPRSCSLLFKGGADLVDAQMIFDHLSPSLKRLDMTIAFDHDPSEEPVIIPKQLWNSLEYIHCALLAYVEFQGVDMKGKSCVSISAIGLSGPIANLDARDVVFLHQLDRNYDGHLIIPNIPTTCQKVILSGVKVLHPISEVTLESTSSCTVLEPEQKKIKHG